MASPRPSLKPLPDSDVRELRALVEDLTERVAQLERRLKSETPPELLPPTVPPPVKSDFSFGPKLINRIGALTLAIGIIFFFKYAVDSRWIGALGRVVLGLFAGIALTGVAEWLRKRNQQVFSQGVAGCGLATIFISVYAAFAYYRLASQMAGFVALVLTCALAVLLSLRYASVSIAVLSFIGAVLTPLLLRTSGARPVVALHFPYLLLVSITAIIISLRQRWTVLMPIIGGFVLFAALFLINESHPDLFIFFCFLFAALHFGSAARAASISRLSDALYLVGHAAVILAFIRIVALWAAHHSAPADRISLTSELESFLIAAYGIAMASSGVVRKSTADRALAIVLLAFVVAKLYLWDVWQLTRFYLITAFVALGVVLLVASFLYSRFRDARRDET